FFFFSRRCPLCLTLFPYTTLFRSVLAEREDGSTFRDSDVRQRLIDKGFENVVIGSSREWMRCSPAELKTAVTELQKGLRLAGTQDRKSTRLNSSHDQISYAVFCLK